MRDLTKSCCGTVKTPDFVLANKPGGCDVKEARAQEFSADFTPTDLIQCSNGATNTLIAALHFDLRCVVVFLTAEKRRAADTAVQRSIAKLVRQGAREVRKYFFEFGEFTFTV